MHTKKINIKTQVHWHYENFVKPKKLQTKIFLWIRKAIKTCEFFIRYHPGKSITMLNMYFDEFIGKLKEYEEKNN